MADASYENSFDYLRKVLRNKMNEVADNISTGGAADFPEYKQMCGVIEGAKLGAEAAKELLKDKDKKDG